MMSHARFSDDRDKHIEHDDVLEFCEAIFGPGAWTARGARFIHDVIDNPAYLCIGALGGLATGERLTTEHACKQTSMLVCVRACSCACVPVPTDSEARHPSPFFTLHQSRMHAGLTGGGGGLVSSVGLSLLAPMSQQEIIGTALAAQAPVSALVCLGHAAAGHVHWALGGALAVGCSIGMTLATPYVDAMPEKPLRWMLAGMMVFG